ncbi:MAG: hypothetical protein ACRDL7_05680 [Gaiellaceae bacterium]
MSGLTHQNKLRAIDAAEHEFGLAQATKFQAIAMLINLKKERDPEKRADQSLIELQEGVCMEAKNTADRLYWKKLELESALKQELATKMPPVELRARDGRNTPVSQLTGDVMEDDSDSDDDYKVDDDSTCDSEGSDSDNSGFVDEDTDDDSVDEELSVDLLLDEDSQS